MQENPYQLIIIGGGPAGLTAGLYASRGLLNAVLLEKGTSGGQMLTTDWIDNYPGFVEGVSGYDLIEKMAAQADRFGLVKKFATLTSMDLEGRIKRLTLDNGETLETLSVILCTGAKSKRLNIPGEQEFIGRGVSFCATCDAPFYRGQHVAVVGGGNTSLQEALHLAKFASQVTITHRRDELRATKILQQKAFANPKIDFIWNSKVRQVLGDKSGVTSLLLEDAKGSKQTLAVTGIFVFIGIQPNNSLLPMDKLQADENGFIITDEEMATAIPGVFAAGDIRSKYARQIINAAGEGAVAALSAERYLEHDIPLETEQSHE